MNDLLGNLDSLTPEQRELLTLLLDERGVEVSDAPASAAIPRVPRPDGRAPLSFAQQRLWFLEQLTPGSATYNIPSALRLTGDLNVPALRRSLQTVIDRHEVLRTHFANDDEGPIQVIEPGGELPLPMLDLAEGQSSSEIESAVEQIVRDEARSAFDLARAPLLRARLLRLSQDEHILLFNMHHIVSDGWSVGVLIREVASLYAVYVAQPEITAADAIQVAQLPRLTVQYADFAAWQRHYLQGRLLESQLDYWRNKLANSPALLDLPADRPRPPVQSGRGGVHYLSIDHAVAASLRELAQAEGATMFAALLAAFQVLLSRHSGQDDIPVGIPVANRTRTDLEPLIGYFVNTLVIRAEISPDASFRGLLRQVRDLVVEAQANQDVQFEMLVEALRPERNMSHTPLFQVMFAFQAGSPQRVQLPGLVLTPLATHSGAAKFDLLLNLTDAQGDLVGSLEYNADLFDPQSIVKLAQRFAVLLGGIVEDPDRNTAALPLLSPDERQQALRGWNNTAAVYEPPVGLHQLFEAQVDRTPNALAAIAESSHEDDEVLNLAQRITYADLDRRANQLARYLMRNGIKPEALVAICAERSLDMLVGLLGILKAGAAYVPIDPAYPRDRKQTMLADSGATILLTQSGLAQSEQWAAEAGVRMVCLDTEWDLVSQFSAERPQLPIHPGQLAYMIYTSGSTGRPKGAMVHHGGIVNRLCWMQSEYNLTADDRIMQKTPFSFDVSVWEFFWPLIAGAALVFARPEGHKDAGYLVRLIDAAGISTMHFVPSMLASFLSNAPVAGDSSLKRVICSGEALPYDLQERFFARYPRVALHNLYGPTEAAVDVTYWPCQPGDPRRNVPIGYPVANTQMYVLNREMEPAPPGTPGELYIGGVQVGRGYHDRPDLTAERFIPNPFVGHGVQPGAGARLYRTGDLARWLPDGAIEFLGRIDFQVKIRGFRIELGEIEVALRRHPALRDAVVVARADGAGGELRLVGYVVAKPGETAPAIAELRSFLLTSLPDYMAPAVFIDLPAMPLSPNGKVDRKALPVPSVDRTLLGVTYVRPRTSTEEILAGIWSQLLGVPRVGIHDSFFDLGGHSLIATQLVSRVRDAFHIELPLAALFETTTIAGLAPTVDSIRMAESSGVLPPIVPTERQPDADGSVRLPLSFAQQRLWFLEQLDPGGTLYNIPSAMRLSGPLDAEALEAALNDIVARHESLRTTFGDAAGKAFQVIWPAMPLAVSRVDLAGEPPAVREAAALELARREALRPFDLVRGPLIRCHLVRLSEEDHVLLLIMHHIISDGWSVAVLVREVAELYQARLAGRPAALPPPPLQYADFAAWQHTWLEKGAPGEGDLRPASPLQQQLAYWQDQLKELPALIELPTDRPRPPALTYRGALRTFGASPELSEQVRAFSRSEGATLYMTLLAALEVLMQRLTGQDDFAIGSPIAGRRQAELEPVIGFFVNTLAVRSDLRARPANVRKGEVASPVSFRELVQRVRGTTLDAYAHQDVPFELLVGSLNVERSANHTPLFQVMLTLQNIPAEPLHLPGLTIAPYETPSETAKFDLNWTFVDDPAGLRAALEYSSDLFDAETADRFARAFLTLLQAVVAEPDRPLVVLPILSGEEQTLVLGEWNETTVAIDTAASIPLRFEEQVRRTPAALAVVAEETDDDQTRVAALSYLELNARANQLARHLRTLGVGPESIVGLTIERSTELLVGVLGILKAGAAYLPLDPSYPPDRLAYMLEDSGAYVLVTHARYLSDQPARVTAVCLDRDWPQVSRLADDNLAPAAGPDNLAYVIYTSGSTGRPKGVMIQHRSALNLAGALHEAAYRRSPLERPLRVSLNAPLAFDASVQQLVMLTLGHTLYVIPQDVRGDGAAFLDFIRRHQLDQFDCVPSQLKLLLEAGLLSPGAAWTPSIVFPGGEAIDDATWARLAAAPATDFYNMYGPTECTVDSTTVSARQASAHATIGRPMANVRAYVLDRNLQPTLVGVPGELFLAGDGVGRGYLNRPDLTAERFLPDPFTSEHTPGLPEKPDGRGARMYRTGDLVRWTRDGLLEFLGRVDFQVKVRGFRIELGEIEDALRGHPGVREAVVAVREAPGATGAKQLVGYVTPADAEAAPAVSDLRQHLLAALPDYMVPAIFVTLESMPLTPNGKVDRRALPTAEAMGYAASGREFVPPGAPAEQALADIWSQVLGVPLVGVNDNFFELGGDSILSIQVIARANQVGLHLTPKQLFQSPTVAGLAALAGTARTSAAEQGPVDGPVSRTPIQRRFFELDWADRSHWNQSVLLSVRQRLEPAALQAALDALIEHHDALRLRFQETPTGWQALGAAPGAEPSFVHVDLSGVSDADLSSEIERLCADVQGSLDITHGPLIRAAYFDAGAQRPGRLLLVIHHLAVDGVSWRVLLEDLQAAYAQHTRGAAISLPPKTTSFKAWSEKLAAHARSEAVTAELDYWLERTSGWIPTLPVDAADDGAANTEASAAQVDVALSQEETDALLTQANEAYNTEVADLLLTSLALAVARWTGTPTLYAHLEGHGREEIGEAIDVSRTVGWFTTLYPVRLDLPAGGEETPGEAIVAVKEQLRAIPNHGIGYGLLRYLGGDEAAGALAAQPDPEITFNYLGQFDQVLAASGADALLGPAPEMPGRDRAPENRRTHLLDVTAAVAGHRLSVSFTYSRARHAESTVRQLADRYLAALQSLIAHCRSPEAGAYTPSDFPLAELDQKQLDKVLKKVSTRK